MDVQSHIKDVLSDSVHGDGDLSGNINEQDLLQALDRKGIVQQLMQRLNFSDNRGSTQPALSMQTSEKGSSKRATHFVDKTSLLTKKGTKSGTPS